jgi:hypothetical protein
MHGESRRGARLVEVRSLQRIETALQCRMNGGREFVHSSRGCAQESIRSREYHMRREEKTEFVQTPAKPCK